jgi:hypothetical protein
VDLDGESGVPVVIEAKPRGACVDGGEVFSCGKEEYALSGPVIAPTAFPMPIGGGPLPAILFPIPELPEFGALSSFGRFMFNSDCSSIPSLIF